MPRAEVERRQRRGTKETELRLREGREDEYLKLIVARRRLHERSAYVDDVGVNRSDMLGLVRSIYGHDANPSQGSHRLNVSEHAQDPIRASLNVSNASYRSHKSRGISVPKKPMQPNATRPPRSVSSRRGRGLRGNTMESAAKVFEEFYLKSKVLLSELEEKVLGVKA
jgi:hypothetical protein